MSDKEGNWWEFYGVRYAQGTVVGAMLMFFLFSQHPDLKKILFVPAEAKDFGVPHLVLLAVYGLAYCYISSAPILLMHAARGLLFKSLTNPTPTSGWQARSAWVVTPSLLITAGYYFVLDRNFLNAIVLFLFLLIIAFQSYLLWEIFRGSWDRVIKYYVLIVKKRKEHKDGGYVESYKHIREHGNSFLIVLFQFILAVPIFFFVVQPGIEASAGLAHLVTIILLWTFPASFIWAFGNKLETHLQNM